MPPRFDRETTPSAEIALKRIHETLTSSSWWRSSSTTHQVFQILLAICHHLPWFAILIWCHPHLKLTALSKQRRIFFWFLSPSFPSLWGVGDKEVGEYFHSIESEKEFESTPTTSNCIQLLILPTLVHASSLPLDWISPNFHSIDTLHARRTTLLAWSLWTINTYSTSDWQHRLSVENVLLCGYPIRIHPAYFGAFPQKRTAHMHMN